MPEDEEAKKEGYRIVDYRAIHNFLEDHSKISHPIFQDYRDYIRRRFFEPYDNGLRLFFDENKLLDECGRVRLGPEGKAGNGSNQTTVLLSHAFIQVEFMTRLWGAMCKMGGVQPAFHDRSESMKKPWSHGENYLNLYFWMQDGISSYPEGTEELIYQVGQRRGAYFLSLRQYARVTGNQQAKHKKLARLAVFRDIFDRVQKKLREGNMDDKVTLKFGRRIGDHSGHIESEIAVLFFDEENNTPERVLQEFPEIHKAFFDELGCSMALLQDLKSNGQ